MDKLKECFLALKECKIEAFIVALDGQVCDFKGLKGKISVYSGSFNPLHEGHRSVFEKLKGTKYFEISLARRDKEFLTLKELETRLQQFQWLGDVVVTNSPKFLDKIKLFKNCQTTFHIGIDTARRLVQDDGVTNIENMPCKFVVYDRIIDGQLRSLRNIKKVPLNFKKGKTPDKNHLHINSTELRKRA